MPNRSKLAELILAHAKNLNMNTRDPKVLEHLRRLTEEIIRRSPNSNDDLRAHVVGLMLPKHAPVKLAGGGQVAQTFSNNNQLNAPQQQNGNLYTSSQKNMFADGGEVTDEDRDTVKYLNDAASDDIKRNPSSKYDLTPIDVTAQRMPDPTDASSDANDPSSVGDGATVGVTGNNEYNTPDAKIERILNQAETPITGQTAALQQAQDIASNRAATQTPEAMARAQRNQNVPLAGAQAYDMVKGYSPDGVATQLSNLGPNQLAQQQSYGNNSLDQLNRTNGDVSATQGGNIGNGVAGANALAYDPQSAQAKTNQNYAISKGVPPSVAGELSVAGMGNTYLGKQLGQIAGTEGAYKAQAATAGQFGNNARNAAITDINTVQTHLKQAGGLPSDLLQAIAGNKITNIASYAGSLTPVQKTAANYIISYVTNHPQFNKSGVIDTDSLNTQLNIEKNKLQGMSNITNNFASSAPGLAEGGEVSKVTIIPEIPDAKLHEFARRVTEEGHDPVECAYDLFGDKADHVMDHIQHFADGGEVTPFENVVPDDEIAKEVTGDDDLDHIMDNASEAGSSHDGVLGKALELAEGAGLGATLKSGLKWVGGKLVRAAPAALAGAEEGGVGGAVAGEGVGAIPGALLGGAIGLGAGLLSSDSDDSETPSDPQEANITSQTSPVDRIQQDHSKPNPDISQGAALGSPFLNAKNRIDTGLISSISDAEKNKNIPQGLAHAIVQVESNYDPRAVNVNRNGTTDSGLFQVNSTNLPQGSKLNDLLDPATNINTGTNILAKLLAQYDGDVPRAVYAYNHGPGAANFIPETQIKNDPYVRKVLAAWPQRNSVTA